MQYIQNLPFILSSPQFRNCFKKSLVGLKIVIMMSWGFI